MQQKPAACTQTAKQTTDNCNYTLFINQQIQ